MKVTEGLYLLCKKIPPLPEAAYNRRSPTNGPRESPVMIWGLVPLPAAPSALCLGWEWHVWVIGSDSCESITNPWFLNDSSRSSSLKPQCFQPHIFVFHLLYNVFIVHHCRALQNIATMWVWGFCSLKVSLTAERIGQVQLDLALVIKSVNCKYPQNCFICALCLCCRSSKHT